MSTGVKANNGLVGLDSNLGFVKTILEDAQSAGKSVGLVTTTQITHAEGYDDGGLTLASAPGTVNCP